MFDDLNKKTNKVEDIFSDTEKGGKPDILKPVGPTPVPPPVPMAGVGEEGGERKEKMKKLLIFAILIVVVVLIIFGIFWVLKKIDTTLSQGTGDQTQEENLTGGGVPNFPEENQTPEPAPEEAPVAEESPFPAESVFFPPSVVGPADSDQDGLSDEEERSLGTDINNIDTDSDGLFDREEVKVYKTNPLVTDTDGDGYSDGDEVKNGYNPAGAGKLYEIQ
ncbi:MAG: hypothetical protein PHZ04_04275 [Patescibacteria group bacterium]|nr:hypothetical protein [Patescibacteria group bacterium]MDD5554478.1 hypothetical protein [Patescibacteria group bacterium]